MATENSVAVFSRVFEFCANSIVLGEPTGSAFFRAFFQEFPALAKEQELENNSSFGTAGPNRLDIIRFKRFEIKLIFSPNGLLQAVIKMPSAEFTPLKHFLKQEYPHVPPFVSWERGLMGMYEALTLNSVNMEATFTSFLGFNCLLHIKKKD